MNEETIFSAAVEISASDERKAYLEQACGNDADLRRSVNALLQAHENPDSFFEAPAGVAKTIDLPAVAEKLGTMIGNYKLREQIGEGGFGVVYVAEQEEPVRRKVALKVIKAGMDTKGDHRPLRSGTAGAGAARPSQRRQSARRRGDGLRPAVLRHGTGSRYPHYGIL